MNTLNEEDKDTSKRVHEFVRRIVAYNAKHQILAGSYRCVDDNGETAALHGSLGTMILQTNIQIKLARKMPYPNPAPDRRTEVGEVLPAHIRSSAFSNGSIAIGAFFCNRMRRNGQSPRNGHGCRKTT